MISELDRFHGVVLRQLVLASKKPMALGVANASGRVDAYSYGSGAIYIKHCARRLSPWQFTFFPRHIDELAELSRMYRPVWVFLVCGVDGIVGIPADDLCAIVGDAHAASAVRVSRYRKAMYRITGSAGALNRAVKRGVSDFLAAVS